MEKDPSNLEIELPPGFRFHPSDEELIVHYLRNKVTSCPLPASFIADIDLYKFNPWELPSKALFGEDEWFFFTPRDRKYPNGLRPNRAAGLGYWKATGTDKPILSSCGMKSIGVKKALVFYKGRPPKGSKTDWIMHEYRLLDSSVILSCKQRGSSMRLDDWVLCRVRQKISSPTRSTWEELNEPTSDFQHHMNYESHEPEETVKNRVLSEFPLLPYILGSKKNVIHPSMGNPSSSLSNHQHDDHAFVNEEASNIESQFSEFTANKSLMKRKLYEQSQIDLYDSPPFKKLREEDHHERKVQDIDITSESYNSSFSSFFDHWNAILQPHQELNNLAFEGYV